MLMLIRISHICEANKEARASPSLSLVHSSSKKTKKSFRQQMLLLPASNAAASCCSWLVGNKEAKQKCRQHHCSPRTHKISYHLSRLKGEKSVVWKTNTICGSKRPPSVLTDWGFPTSLHAKKKVRGNKRCWQQIKKRENLNLHLSYVCLSVLSTDGIDFLSFFVPVSAKCCYCSVAVFRKAGQLPLPPTQLHI